MPQTLTRPTAPPPLFDDAAPLARRLLVVANETLTDPALIGAIDRLVHPDGRVLLVCPVLVSRPRLWTSDLSAGLACAAARLRAALASLRALGLEVEGSVGDTDPLLAVEDVLHLFPADRLLVATHPPGVSSWLRRHVPEQAEARFGVPVTHAVVR